MADEHVFYIAGAAVVGVSSINQYKLWLLDWRNKGKRDRWLAGGKVPDSECVQFCSDFTFESQKGEIHTVDDRIVKRFELNEDKRLYSDVWHAPSYTTVTVFVSTELWNKLADADKPLPPKPHDELYRIQLLARRDGGGAVKYYFGFHAQVVAMAPSGRPIVKFFSWEDKLLGMAEVDLASSDFEPQGKYTTIAPAVGADGALFVATDAFKDNLRFLAEGSPKVPFGAGQHGVSRDAARARTSAARPKLAASATVPDANAAPVVVASGGMDDWLEEAREIVVGEGCANDESGVAREISRLLDSMRGRDAIELLSHSNDDNLLTFDGWTVNTDAFLDESQSFKDLLRGKVIRLVGCSTARGRKAKRVLRAMQDKLGVIALGTRGLIGTGDLSPEGSAPAERPHLFEPPDTDDSANSGEPEDVFRITDTEIRRGGNPVAFAATDRERLLAELTPESRRVAEQVLGLMPAVTYPFQGILRKPTATIPLVATPVGLPGRIDALFRGQLVRFTRGRWRQPGRIESLFWVPDPQLQARLQEIFRWR